LDVEGERFDGWTRRQFGFLTGGLLARLSGLTWCDLALAKKKRKKKRKKADVCRKAGQPCSTAPDERCCNTLTCSANSCGQSSICLGDQDGSCGDRCDCAAGQQCDERGGFRCGQCTVLQGSCPNGDDDCCLLTAACGSTIFASGVCCQQLGGACGLASDCCANTGNCGLNGCGGVAPVCCRGQGSQCGSNCECCDPLRCLNGMCQ
jgi:hypothetical protein